MRQILLKSALSLPMPQNRNSLKKNWDKRFLLSRLHRLEYIEKLATAEIVRNNQAFPGYYRKRKGQKFVFMDFLPTYYGEGRFASYSAKNMQGIQFSLAQADVILFPKEKKEIFGKCLEAYNMQGTL